jgi:ribonuclease P protein component
VLVGQAGEFMAQGQGPVPFFLKRSRDIEHIKKVGRRVSTGWFNLQFCPDMFSDAMLGIVIGRRFGTAVRRNRAKRLFRELGRSVRPALLPGYGVLVFPKRECLALPFAELENLWRSTLRRQRLARFGEPAL